MIKVGDKYLRNLEETVQYLVNYHDVNQGLVQWGIRVVGQVLTSADLPNPNTYTGEYGDTYAVGTAPPYDFYIWTRAAIEGGSDYWFPFGKISIAGPQGPTPLISNNGTYIISTNPETGTVQNIISIADITGKSTRWYSGFNVPARNDSLYNPGDMFLVSVGNEAGNVYIYVQDQGFQFSGNIRGPQGIQGPQGPQGPRGEQGPQGEKGATGDVGGFINIWGILANKPQLEQISPSVLKNLTVAYLVGAQEPYDLYIQVGETSDTATWTNTGPFNAATAVTVNGSYQNVWDADTKLDKLTISSGKAVYAALADGTQGWCSVSTNNYTCYPNTGINTSGAVAGYVTTNWGAEKPIGDGILLSNDPTQPYQVATKNYVDINTASTAKLSSTSSDMNRVFGIKNDGSIYNWYIGGIQGQQFSRNSFATYWTANEVPLNMSSLVGSRLFTGDPSHDYHATPKKYVDSKTALYKTTILIQPDPDTQYRIFANTHKAIDTEGSTFGELCESLTLPEDVAENPYNGIQNFVFGHIVIDGTLQFIVAAEYAVNSDTFNIMYSVGNQANYIQINPNAECTAVSVKV